MTEDIEDPERGHEDPPNSKPRILVAPGDMHLAHLETEALLAATGMYFHSGGALVRIVHRGGQGISTERVNEQTLKLVLSSMIDWQRERPDGIRLRCDPPHGVIQALLFGQDRAVLPVLNALARQPYYAADGRLIANPGYDAGTGIYGAFNASDYRLDNPIREQAEHSLAYLVGLLSEFEFESEADLSAAICGMLTAACRPSLPAAPAFLLTATNPGSGKSCLADVLSFFAGPEEPYRVTFPERPDEAAKLIVSVLMEKPAVVLFDDMQTNWKSLGPLNRVLTSPTTTERMLGSNRTATVTTRQFFLGTGNQIEPERDARRRVLPIHLAPRHETPALRTFRGDPVGHMRKHRAQAVECALTIIGAFQASGATVEKVRSIGTYEDWSQYCRFPLLWLGLPDPAHRLINQMLHDPARQSLAELLDAWWRCFGEKSVTVRKVISTAQEQPDLAEALEELPLMDGRFISPGKLGWFLKKNCGRRADGSRFEPGDSSERRSWRVVIDSPPPGSSAPDE